MCLSPISKPNPNYGSSIPWKDCTSQRLSIPCGYCPQCIAVKQMRYVQRIEMEAQKNYLFMCTLTYDNEHLPVYGVYSDPYRPDLPIPVKYADVSHVQAMNKRLREQNSFGIPFRFAAVSELGSKHGRPHFHILYLFEKKYFKSPFNLADLKSFEQKHYFTPFNHWCVNVGTDRSPVYEPLSRYIVRRDARSRTGYTSTYDFHFVYELDSPNGVADVAFYVLKYMLKPSARAVKLQQALKINLPGEQYSHVWNTIKPRFFKSLGFGLNVRHDVRNHIKSSPDSDIIDHLHEGISTSLRNKHPYPEFFSPNTGLSFPLAPYYKNNDSILTQQDLLDFWSNSDPDTFSKIPLDHQILYFKDQFDKANKLYSDFLRHNKQVDDNSEDIYFNDLFNN